MFFHLTPTTPPPIKFEDEIPTRTVAGIEFRGYFETTNRAIAQHLRHRAETMAEWSTGNEARCAELLAAADEIEIEAGL